MKRYIYLSALSALLAAAVVSPLAQAQITEEDSAARSDELEGCLRGQQVSSPEQISEDATFHDMIQYNRCVRDKK